MPWPTSARRPRSCHVGVHRELLVAELAADLAVRVGRMRLGHADRHVHVVDVRGERTEEHRHHEARVDGVHDQIHAVRPGQHLHGAGIGRIDLCRRVADSVTHLVRDATGPVQVVIREHHLLQPRSTCTQPRDRLSDRPHTDQQHLHDVSSRSEERP